MGKIYETERANYNVCTNGGPIPFTPVNDPNINQIFGTFDSSTEHVLKSVTVPIKDEFGEVKDQRPSTPDELEKIIEALPAFKNCVTDKTIGVRGIWIKEDRLNILRKRMGAAVADPKAGLKGLDDDTLKMIIESKGGTYPAEVSHDKLVEIAASLQGKTVKKN